MHYIRFLKHPSIAHSSKGLVEVKALCTITSDLGESTYPEDVWLIASLIDAGSSSCKLIQRISLEWKASSHALPLILTTSIKSLAKVAFLQIVIEADHSGIRTAMPSTDTTYVLTLPHILSTASIPFNLGQSLSEADTLTQRPIPLYDDPASFSVGEDTGPSIDRHVWDAGVGLAALFSWLIVSSTKPTQLRSLTAVIQSTQKLRALELGTGVGLVGLALAHLRRSTQLGRTEVTLTDVESARPIAERNASLLLGGSPSPAAPDNLAITFAPLDWEAPLPADIAGQVYDLVLVSDCTYNPDSGPALVRTLKALAECSPSLLVVVASKTRHESEAVFWQRMGEAGFRVCEHVKLLARGGVDDDAIAVDEVVDVHLFQFKSA
jgi:hypothetical protein